MPRFELPPERVQRITASNKQTRADLVADAFAGRYFEVVREFHLPPSQRVATPLGNLLQHGWIIRDTATGKEYAVGRTLLRQIHDEHGSVELPYRTRRRRKRAAEPAAED